MTLSRSEKMEGFFSSRTRALAIKHVHLKMEIEQLPLGTEFLPDKEREIKMIEAELRQKLYSSLIGDVLPIQISDKGVT